MLELCTLLLVFFSFLQKVSGQQILERCIKDFVYGFVVHIHALTKIQNQVLFGMDPKVLAIKFFHNFFLKRERFRKSVFFLFTIFNDPEQGRDKIA